MQSQLSFPHRWNHPGIKNVFPFFFKLGRFYFSSGFIALERVPCFLLNINDKSRHLSLPFPRLRGATFSV